MADGGDESLLSVRDLVKDFGGLRAIDHCTLDVRPGTITGLIGPNGAGKTTLFNIVTGFIPPDAGRVFFRGDDITNLPPHRIFSKKLSRTFQIPREHQSMTVLENLMLVPPRQVGERLWNNWFRPGAIAAEEARIRDKALEVLDFVDLDHLAEEPSANLSGGQKKLLELARTLMADPELVLLDEPFNGISPALIEVLIGIVQRLNREEGKTFLLISHEMPHVGELCETVTVLSAGSDIARGTVEEIRNEPAVIDAYLGQ